MLAENFGIPWLQLDLPFPCEIHYRMPLRLEQNENFKVLWLNSEPTPLIIPYEQLAPVHHFFDLIIAANPRFADFPNSIIEPYGTIWVTRLPQKKDFSVSFLFSLGAAGMVMMSGYHERIGLTNNLDRITAPMRMFKGLKVPPGFAETLPSLEGNTKDCLFDSMFHISIENNCETNYFTEKICDCFATYTVPIYIGCPNIGDYFDLDGIIIARDHQHMIELINALTPDDYWRRLPALRANFLASQKYWDTFPLKIRKMILQRWHARQSSLQTA